MKILIFFLLISLFFLNACTQEPCIDADDFGQFISTKILSNALDANKSKDEHFSYVEVPWQDNNLILNGKKLVITLSSYGEQKSRTSTNAENVVCDWYGGDKANNSIVHPNCAPLKICSKEDKTLESPDSICKYDGEYLEIATFNNDKINLLKFDSISNDVYSAGNQLNDRVEKNQIVYVVNQMDNYKDQKLFFRIKSNFYTDNSGHYLIKIRNGIQSSVDTGNEGLISSIENLVKDALITKDTVNFEESGFVNIIYSSFINNPNFQNIVKTMIILNVIFLGFAFIIGQTNFTIKNLFFYVLKLIIVSLIFTNNSWEFFFKYFFQFFIEGVDQLRGMINNIGSSDLGGSVNQSILSLLFSSVVNKKITSLLFVFPFPLGIFYFILIYALFVCVFLVMIEITVVYLMSFIMLILVISLFPIMITFVLFSVTRSLFDNWLNSLVSYFIRPILLFVGVSFFFSMIGDEVYKTLGFRICHKSILGIIHYWYPDPYVSEDFYDQTVDMLVPIAHFPRDEKGSLQKDGSGNVVYCEAFECTRSRYPDLPLLDPNNSFDQLRINKFQKENFLHWEALMWMVIYILLAGIYLKLVNRIADFIASARTVSTPSIGIKQRITQPLIGKGLKKITNQRISQMYFNVSRKGLKQALKDGIITSVVHKVRDLGFKKEKTISGSSPNKILNTTKKISQKFLTALKSSSKIKSNFNQDKEELLNDIKNSATNLKSILKGNLKKFESDLNLETQELKKTGEQFKSSQIKAIFNNGKEKLIKEMKQSGTNLQNNLEVLQSDFNAKTKQLLKNLDKLKPSEIEVKLKLHAQKYLEKLRSEFNTEKKELLKNLKKFKSLEVKAHWESRIQSYQKHVANLKEDFYISSLDQNNSLVEDLKKQNTRLEKNLDQDKSDFNVSNNKALDQNSSLVEDLKKQGTRLEKNLDQDKSDFNVRNNKALDQNNSLVEDLKNKGRLEKI
ncbi:MAG: type IV secretion system protein [Rickettsia sp.]|nr:type IV secretion system protein [Rickettsia sp.]